jgi:hypothetical protein
MPPRAWNRLRITLRFVAAIPCTPPAHCRTSLLWSPSSDFVPSQPHQLHANSIQSPYIHRANGLLQIAVSTPLRTRSIGAREVLAAEHCRYGTRDLLLIEKTSIKLALNYPDLVAHTKPRRVPKNLSWVHLGFGVTRASRKHPSALGEGRRNRIEFRSSQPAQRRESPSRDRIRY